MRRKMLITGAAGDLGSFLAARLAGCYQLVLTDLRRPGQQQGSDFFQADITALEEIKPLCQDTDTVLHLAADHRADAPWESLLPSNIVGAYNVFEAAHQAGCRRVVFASSIHAVLGYTAGIPLGESAPVRPPDLYGATKAWGEALARFYADQKGLSVVCLRLGWVIGRERIRCFADHPDVDMMLTYEDLQRLVTCAIEAPDHLRFGIFNGISNNQRKRLDISRACAELNYKPQDDAFVLAAAPASSQDGPPSEDPS